MSAATAYTHGIIVNTAGYGGKQSPDIVGNIRVDQTWGSAQVMAAAHQVNAGHMVRDHANAPSPAVPAISGALPWVADCG